MNFVPIFFQEFSNLESVSLKNSSQVIDLDDQNTDVNLVPGNGLEDRPLCSLDVQAMVNPEEKN